MSQFFKFNDKTTLCLLRLRASDRYLKPLETIVDSYFYVYKKFLSNNSQYNYRFFSTSFTNKRPIKNFQDIRESDYIIIPSEAEFLFHTPGRVMNFAQIATDAWLNKIRKVIDGKKIIILQSDRADSIDLYKNYVFPDNNIEIFSIDECDFKGGIHVLKYYFIKERVSYSKNRNYSFVYWGTSKKKKVGGGLSGDIRHEILKDIYKSNISSWFIGNFDGFKRDSKFSKKLLELPNLLNGKSTLCFNWPGYDEFTTSRYSEALGFGIIPFVWQNYDCNNTLVSQEWQRVFSFADLEKKIKELDNDIYFEKKFEEIHTAYLQKIEPISNYVLEFDKKLKRIIDV